MYLVHDMRPFIFLLPQHFLPFPNDIDTFPERVLQLLYPPLLLVDEVHEVLEFIEGELPIAIVVILLNPPAYPLNTLTHFAAIIGCPHYL